MHNHTLVTYASLYGSSAEIAERIGARLRAHAMSVDVCPVSDDLTVEGYANVVMGGAIYSGEWHQDLTNFVHRHTATLQHQTVAFFVVAMRLRDDTDAMCQSILSTIETQRILLAPIDIGLFAGKVDYSTLSPIVRLQVQTKKLPEGDFRNWDAIDVWANQLAPRLESQPATGE